MDVDARTLRAMVRLLVEAEWSSRDGHDLDKACPWCKAWRYTGATHKESCPFLAVMRKLGLR